MGLQISLAIMSVMQLFTIVLVMNVPTEKVEMVCRGLYESPNVIRCYEQ